MEFSDFLHAYPALVEHFHHSNNVLEHLRHDLHEALKESAHRDKITIVTTGSYGRKEASLSSDLDLFIFFDSDRSEGILSEETEKIRQIVEKYIAKAAGDTGTFGVEAIVRFSDMLANIGGNNDSNANLTRRMLFLLEGTWLYGEDRFKSYRAELLSIYIKTSNPEKQISRFLLNDIIRYYRTITTDFEFKVTENNKSWGLRNVKLRFSRKILYFGGILSVAETALESNDDKSTALSELFDLAVLNRIWSVGPNNPHTKEIFDIYQHFLSTIGDSDKRQLLDQVSREKREESMIFLEMRAKSRDFSVCLANWLKAQYADNEQNVPHPIHNALLF